MGPKPGGQSPDLSAHGLYTVPEALLEAEFSVGPWASSPFS